MATSPSPNSPVTAAAPTSGVPSPPQPPLSSSNSSTTTPAPTLSQPDQTSDPPVPSTPSNSSTPPPQSSPPATPAAPPPSPPLSPPPSATSPPPSSTSPPPTSPPPPSPPASPPPSPPSVPPPAENSPPPPILSPPPPSRGSPPQVSPAPPAATPPSPQAISHSPPPPSDVPSPPSSNSPPPPVAKSPQSSSPLTVPPPSTSQPASPPSTNSPPRSTLLSPPPSVPSSSSPSPPINSSATETPTISPLPSFPIEKPIATDSNTNATSTASGINTGGAVAIGIVVGFVVLSFVAMAVWFVQKRKKRVDGSSVMPSPFASSQKSDSSFLRPHSAALKGSSSGNNFMYSPSEASGVGNSRSWFTYEELVMATDGFSAENLLGEGGFGCVYKGCVADGREVAVKQLKIGGGQGEREFRAEVEIISRVHHRHLVSLVGYCISEHQRLLVYDYVPNDTLHFHLHGKDMPVLDWATRFRVAAGAARGIAYLHEDCHPRIIHRDIKSSNILLDKNFEAQARPLLTKALENEDFEGLVDTRLEKNYIDIELFRMVEAAAACVRHSAVKRPRMGQVVRAFDSIGEFSDLSNGMKPGQSTIFNSAEQSAQIRMFQRMAFGSQDYSSEIFNQSQSSWGS